VISQSPLGGFEAPPSTTVNLVISLGPQPVVTVPNIVGLPRASAEAALLAAGLTVGVFTEEYSDTVPAGIVISQNPAAGVEVLLGAAVVAAVSLGPQRCRCPM
jgi:serine/threonine-protein kinase